jgi:ankyrin repeat protein
MKRPNRILFYLLIKLVIFSCYNISVAAPDENILFENQLVDAAEIGNTLEVISLIKGGTSPNVRGIFGTTPLLRASFRGHLEIAKALIAAGADLNASDIGGATPLHIASRHGQSKIVDLLLTKGAMVDAADKDGWTPLMRAASAKHADIVDMLLSKGANPSLSNKWHTNALVDAVRSQNPKIIKTFINHRAFGKVSELERAKLLSIAQNSHNQEVLSMVQDAISQEKVSLSTSFPENPANNTSIPGLQIKVTNIDKEDLIELPNKSSLSIGDNKRENVKAVIAVKETIQEQPKNLEQTEKVNYIDNLPWVAGEYKEEIISEAELEAFAMQEHLTTTEKVNSKVTDFQPQVANNSAIRVMEAINIPLTKNEPVIIANKQTSSFQLKKTEINDSFWIEAGQFMNSEEANSYYQLLLQQNLPFRIKQVRPYNQHGLISIRVGPVSTEKELNKICDIIGGKCVLIEEQSKPILSSASPPNPSTHQSQTSHWLQLGTFDNEEEGERYFQSIKFALGPKLKTYSHSFSSPISSSNYDSLYRLRLGPMASLEKAESTCNILNNKNINCVVVSE